MLNTMGHSWDIFKTINEFSRFSDTKAGVILAFAGGSAVFLSNRIDALHEIIVQHAADCWGIALYVVVFAYLVSLVGAIAAALKSIWPSMGNGETRSLIFFKHIAEDFSGDHARYAEKLRSLDDQAMEAELAQQICANAVIAHAKFEWVSRAARAMVCALGAWAAIILLLLVLGTGMTGR